MHGPHSHRSRPAMPRAAGAGSPPLRCTPAPPPSTRRANAGRGVRRPPQAPSCCSWYPVTGSQTQAVSVRPSHTSRRASKVPSALAGRGIGSQPGRSGIRSLAGTEAGTPMGCGTVAAEEEGAEDEGMGASRSSATPAFSDTRPDEGRGVVPGRCGPRARDPSTRTPPEGPPSTVARFRTQKPLGGHQRVLRTERAAGHRRQGEPGDNGQHDGATQGRRHPRNQATAEPGNRDAQPG